MYKVSSDLLDTLGVVCIRHITGLLEDAHSLAMDRHNCTLTPNLLVRALKLRRGEHTSMMDTYPERTTVNSSANGRSRAHVELGRVRPKPSKKGKDPMPKHSAAAGGAGRGKGGLKRRRKDLDSSDSD